MPEIPMDVYESPAEMIIHLPLWWVDKESLNLTLNESLLTIQAQRVQPTVKESLATKLQSCYRWSFEKTVSLPATSFFNGIQSILTPSNILIITIPKVMVPDSVPVTIQ